jgi:TRAP-type C4-dicarboxylate transport system substrate-binding protein
MRRALLVLVLALFASASRTVRADDTLKMGTLAPADSPWGQVFKAWARNVDQQSSGSMKLDWQWGGTAGDENAMVSSMKSNQLDGAAITAVGLGQIFPDVLVFQLPGAFSSWTTMNAARTQLRPKLDAGFDSAGFKILGWGDVGAAKIMTNGFVAKVPSDLAGKGCFYVSGDPIWPEVFRRIGGVTPKQVSVPEIFPNLQNGTISVVNAPPLAAQQLQWSSFLTNINTETVSFGIGAIVVASSRFSQLPADAQQILVATGASAAGRLTNRIRLIDDSAFAQMKNQKTAYDPTASEKAQWAQLFLQVRQSLRGNPFSVALFDAAMIAGHGSTP